VNLLSVLELLFAFKHFEKRHWDSASFLRVIQPSWDLQWTESLWYVDIRIPQLFWWFRITGYA